MDSDRNKTYCHQFSWGPINWIQTWYCVHSPKNFPSVLEKGQPHLMRGVGLLSTRQEQNTSQRRLLSTTLLAKHVRLQLANQNFWIWAKLMCLPLQEPPEPRLRHQNRKCKCKPCTHPNSATVDFEDNKMRYLHNYKPSWAENYSYVPRNLVDDHALDPSQQCTPLGKYQLSAALEVFAILAPLNLLTF